MFKNEAIVLGASVNQIPLITKLKDYDFHVVTIDNAPLNTGHTFSDEYVNISIDNASEVYAYMKENNINHIYSVCSDLGIRTLYYCQQRLGLTQVDHQTINKVTTKNGLRKFLREHGIESFQFFELNKQTDMTSFFDHISKVNYDLIVKPVDSSGSKGISVINRKIDTDEITKSISYAFSHSKSQEVIVEKFIKGTSVTVNAFVKNAKIIFMEVTNKYQKNGILPLGHSFPSKLSPRQITAVKDLATKIIEKLHYIPGPYDFDIIVDENTYAHCVEASPRLGGNCLYQLVKHSTHFDEINEIVSNSSTIPEIAPPQPTLVRLIISQQSGILEEIPSIEVIRERFSHIVEMNYDVTVGDKIDKFTQGNHRLGYFILQGADLVLLEKKADEVLDFIKIKVK